MPLFDFGGPHGSAAGMSAGKRRRVFDFGDADDDSDALGVEEPPSHVRDARPPREEIPPPSAGNELLDSLDESSLTPASQKSHPSRAPSMPRLAHAALQHSSTYSQGRARDSQEPAPDAASIVDRIWRQASTPSLSAQKRRQGGEKRAEEELGAVRRQELAPSETHKSQHHSLQRPSPGSLLPGNRPTPSSSVDRLWDEACTASNRSEPADRGGLLPHPRSRKAPGTGAQHGTFSGEGEQHDWQQGQNSQQEQGFGSQARPFSAPRDAWKERERQARTHARGDDDADHYARQVLLSPPQTSFKGAKSQRDRCASIDYVDDEHDVAAGGWGAQSARARGGRAAGMGDGRGGRGVPNAGMPDDHFFADDGPRPCVPGPAGKLGRVEVGAVKGVGVGRVSPVLLHEKGDAGDGEEQDASRNMREGIALDVTGPKLPLRRTFLVRLFGTCVRLSVCISHIFAAQQMISVHPPLHLSPK